MDHSQLSDIVMVKLKRAIDMVKSAKGLDLSISSIDISIKFFVIPVIDEECHIITGTRDMPAGIRATEATFCAFVKGEDPVGFMTIEDTISIIKENAKDSKTELDEDYKHLKYIIPYQKFQE